MAYNNGFPMNYQQYFPQYQMPQPQTQSSSIIWVQGEQAARSYLIQPNSTIALWDSDAQKIYLKSADASGMPSIKTLEYTILDGQPQQKAVPSVEYATKEEVEKMRERLDHLYNELEGDKQ